MNANGIEIFLMAVAVSVVNLIGFIYLGNRILNFLKIPNAARVAVKRSSPTMLRRRVAYNPSIICSLPIYQQGRQETPLY